MGLINKITTNKILPKDKSKDRNLTNYEPDYVSCIWCGEIIELGVGGRICPSCAESKGDPSYL